MGDPTCSLAECDRPVMGRGWCRVHYLRWYRHGDPRGGAPERRPFWERVEKTLTCWLWTGARSHQGYGTIGNGPQRYAHRVAYEELVGPIPEGLELDHLCRVRLCVNPAHLEPVSRRENILRGMGASAMNARKTHCVRGHEFTPDNIYRRRDRPDVRICRRCAIDKAGRFKRLRRAAA